MGNHPIETTIYKWLALGFQVCIKFWNLSSHEPLWIYIGWGFHWRSYGYLPCDFWGFWASKNARLFSRKNTIVRFWRAGWDPSESLPKTNSKWKPLNIGPIPKGNVLVFQSSMTSGATADGGWNPVNSPVEVGSLPHLFTRFYTSQAAVWNFFHQQYVCFREGESNKTPGQNHANLAVPWSLK